jgi:DNA-binding transcriptional regulator YdaS (Cro superfamily)
MDLKTYLADLSGEQREALAERCDTSTGHLKNISYGDRRCSPTLALAIERESQGSVKREEVCPEFDWVLARSRNAAAQSSAKTA